MVNLLWVMTATASPSPTPAPSPLPTPSPSTAVVRTATASDVRAGWHSSYVLNAYGSVYALGYRGYGQMGDGVHSAKSYDTLTRVPVLNNIAKIQQSKGLESYATCVVAISDDGNLYYWPGLAMSNAGVSTSTDYTVYGPLTGFSSTVADASVNGVSYYHFVCALLDSGAVECVGYNGNGQLGDGTKTSQATPVAVVGLPTTTTTQVAAAGSSACASNATQVWCWGLNSNGQLGDGTKTEQLSATSVVGSGNFDGDVIDVQCGGVHCCMMLDNGDMSCWGDNAYGQIGDGSKTDQTSPVTVSALSGSVVLIDLGWFRTCALTSSGDMYCWVRFSVAGAG